MRIHVFEADGVPIDLQAGVLIKRRTSGTDVSNVGSRLAGRDRLKLIVQRFDGLMAEARQMGIGLDEVIQLI